MSPRRRPAVGARSAALHSGSLGAPAAPIAGFPAQLLCQGLGSPARSPEMAQEQQVVQALQALYSPATSPAQKTQANHWLTAFQHSAEAWQVPFALLAAEQAQEVQFFATTLLVRKVRSEWNKLDAGSRQGLGQACR